MQRKQWTVSNEYAIECLLCVCMCVQCMLKSNQVYFFIAQKCLSGLCGFKQQQILTHTRKAPQKRHLETETP